jgi:predicted transcriptional regulator
MLMPPKKKDRILTEVELELMNVIWELGECTVRDVQQALPAKRDLAYTTVATMMKILEQKEILSSRASDRAHVYRPRVSRADYEAAALRHVTKSVFQGNPASIVMRLLDESELSREELDQVRALLDEKASKSHDHS